jgi:integrase
VAKSVTTNRRTRLPNLLRFLNHVDIERFMHKGGRRREDSDDECRDRSGPASTAWLGFRSCSIGTAAAPRRCSPNRATPQAALAVTGRRRSTLPLGITPADARAILDSCDRRSVIGRRDYAIIVLLLRLGLRRGEVAGLTLDDIDWRSGALVVRGKGSRSDRLPLPADVGQAIAAYLRRARPATDRREVFLTGRPPVRPIASGTVASTVRRACRRAGVPVMGSHRLRHTAACEMVSAGVPLVQVAQVLRHHSLQTTAGYARIDLERLRRLAAPWPGSADR